MPVAILNLLHKCSEISFIMVISLPLWSKFKTAMGKGKNCQKLKILAFLKSPHQKLLEIVQSKLKISFWEIHYIKRNTLVHWHLLQNLVGAMHPLTPTVTTTLTLTHESEQDLTRKDKQLLSEDFQKRGNIYLTVAF